MLRADPPAARPTAGEDCRRPTGRKKGIPGSAARGPRTGSAGLGQAIEGGRHDLRRLLGPGLVRVHDPAHPGLQARQGQRRPFDLGPALCREGTGVVGSAELLSFDELEGGWWQAVTKFTITVEGAEKPSFVGESVTRMMAPPA